MTLACQIFDESLKLVVGFSFRCWCKANRRCLKTKSTPFIAAIERWKNISRRQPSWQPTQWRWPICASSLGWSRLRKSLRCRLRTIRKSLHGWGLCESCLITRRPTRPVPICTLSSSTMLWRETKICKWNQRKIKRIATVSACARACRSKSISPSQLLQHFRRNEIFFLSHWINCLLNVRNCSVKWAHCVP